MVFLNAEPKSEVKNPNDRIRKEHDKSDLAYNEVMLAHLKVYLVLATRLKAPKGDS